MRTQLTRVLPVLILQSHEIVPCMYIHTYVGQKFDSEAKRHVCGGKGGRHPTHGRNFNEND